MRGQNIITVVGAILLFGFAALYLLEDNNISELPILAYCPLCPNKEDEKDDEKDEENDLQMQTMVDDINKEENDLSNSEASNQLRAKPEFGWNEKTDEGSPLRGGEPTREKSEKRDETNETNEASLKNVVFSIGDVLEESRKNFTRGGNFNNNTKTKINKSKSNTNPKPFLIDDYEDTYILDPKKLNYEIP